MNRKFKHGMSMALAVLSAMFMNTACTEDWNDHYDDNGTNASRTSILDIVKGDADLSNFSAVVEALGCADSLLNQSRVYTLWAPVNEYVNKDSLLAEIEKGNRDKVLNRFVESHIANFKYAASDSMKADNYMLLLNEKMVPFCGNYSDGYTFDGMAVVEKNIPAFNGIVHKIGGTVTYALNLWEYLENAEGADSVAKFLYSFNVSKFDEWASIEGPTVQGNKTYLDSVFSNSNQWFFTYGDKYTAGIGNVSMEDSSYMFVVPANEVWTEWTEKAEKYYNLYLDEKLGEAEKFRTDSLRWFYARKSILNYSLFSKRDQTPVHKLAWAVDNDGDGLRDDSILSTYSVKRRLFSKEDVLAGTREGVECSNGTFYVKDVFNYSPFYTWHDTIKVEAEYPRYQGNEKNKDNFVTSGTDPNVVYVSESQMHDSLVAQGAKLSSNQYVEVAPLASTGNPKLIFTIPETLSSTYNVKIVFVPPHIASPRANPADSEPNKVKLILRATGDNGKQAKLVEVKNIQNDPTRIDTVFIPDAEDPSKPMKIKFPFTEYGFADNLLNASLEITSDVARNDKGFTRVLRIDCIILEPVAEDEE
ncbi:MAG: fasciclin domain-containing protein [Bacteroidaceae bacterium]|nr:fasciclin domain-containing protein [Bacteroidaceae bacterium]